jgi:amidophosphoribosyltransferase
MAARVLSVLGDISNTIFSYVPHTSELAFVGMIEELERLTGKKVSVEKILYKDQVMRTFITQSIMRTAMSAQAYDVTHGIVRPQDTLVIVDDSIVRGTTVKNILHQLSTLNPKKIIMVSSAPLLLYPDCYGIDMSQIDKLIAFQAALGLLQKCGGGFLVDTIAAQCSGQQHEKPTLMKNFVQYIYQLFGPEELEREIARLVYPDNKSWHGQVEVLYQSISGLHKAMPRYTGDWYFTGNYPTPGGFKVLNTSYLQWYHKDSGRAY